MGFPFFKQHDSMDCGPACLHMLANFYGRKIPVQEFRDQAQINKEGVSLLGIAEAAEYVGFNTKAVKTTLQVLTQTGNLPAIIHWNQNHFVILYKVRNNKFFIADPAVGLMTIKQPDFIKAWHLVDENNKEGFALFLKPGPEFFKNSLQKETTKYQKKITNLFAYLKPHKKLIVQLMLGLGIGSLFQFALPFLAKNVVDTAISSKDLNILLLILFAQLALFLGRMTVDFIRNWILLHISTRINVSILNNFLEKLLRLPIPFFDSKNTGDILQRMNDHRRIEQFLTGSSLSILFSLTSLIVFSVTLAMMNILVFYIFLIASVLYAAWIIYFLKKRRIWDYKNFNLGSKEQGLTIQLIQGMQEIKLHAAGKPLLAKWRKLQAALFGLRAESLSLNQWQQAGAFFINESKNILITFWAAKSVIDGQMSLGSMLAIQFIIGQLNSPVEQMIGFVQSLQNAKISMARLNEIHSLDDEEQFSDYHSTDLSPLLLSHLRGGKNQFLENIPFSHAIQDQFNNDPRITVQNNTANAITLQNIGFTYPGAGNNPVLKNIDLSIPLGKTTAIVGMSGSGKTTLLKLLLKFYKPAVGEIRLNNDQLENISHEAWRKQCGVVMQDSFLFSDTIANNIAIGQEKVDYAKLQQAAVIANIDEFINELPLGYNTLIGQEGIGLSKGQQQRLFIARAVYKDPSIIFFDEATNSLDANNEKNILANLSEFFIGKTVIVVAHRLSTVKNADQVVVLKEGTIIESGTHKELIQLKGDYYTLVRNQLD